MPTFTAEHGRQLYFASEGDGPVLLLVHGWAVHGGYFDELAEALSIDFTVIRPDLRGHRHSLHSDDKPTLAQFGADLNALLTQLGAKDVLAVGWSMGAHVCWEYLSQGGDRFRALVVEDMVPKIVNSADWSFGLPNNFSDAHNQAVLNLIRSDWTRYQQLIWQGMFAVQDRNSPGAVDRRAWLEARQVEVEPEALASAWASMADADYRDLLPSLNLPVVVACGARSSLYQIEAADWMVTALPNGRKQIFSASGHAPHIEEPWRFEVLLRSLAAELEG